MKRITLHTFRQVHEAEEEMMRGMMPRTNEKDPVAVPFENTRRSTTKKTFTFKLGEVARVHTL